VRPEGEPARGFPFPSARYWKHHLGNK
jgi:hypothetical protein